jgi:hypothetical protein
MADEKRAVLMEVVVELVREFDGATRWVVSAKHEGEMVFYRRATTSDEIVPHLTVLMRQAEQYATAADKAYAKLYGDEETK